MLAKILMSVGVLLGGGGFLVYSSIDNAQHYKMVDELMVDGDLAQWNGKEMKIHGNVEAGSIAEKIIHQEQQRTFLLGKGGKTIRVFSAGPKPDTFKDAAEVVATGRLVPATQVASLASDLGVKLESDHPYVVEATDLMAKCPSKYDGAQANKSLNDADNNLKYR